MAKEKEKAAKEKEAKAMMEEMKARTADAGEAKIGGKDRGKYAKNVEEPSAPVDPGPCEGNKVFKGVSFNKSTNRWVSQTSIRRKIIQKYFPAPI